MSVGTYVRTSVYNSVSGWHSGEERPLGRFIQLRASMMLRCILACWLACVRMRTSAIAIRMEVDDTPRMYNIHRKCTTSPINVSPFACSIFSSSEAHSIQMEHCRWSRLWVNLSSFFCCFWQTGEGRLGQVRNARIAIVHK